MQDAFTNALATLLSTDAALAAAVAALLTDAPAPIPVLIGNRRVREVTNATTAAWVIDQGDGEVAPDTDNTGLTIGNTEQHFVGDVIVSLVWVEQDEAKASAARQALPALLAKLLMRNPCPGGVTTAWLAGWENDRGGLHPNQLWGARISAEYAIPND